MSRFIQFSRRTGPSSGSATPWSVSFTQKKTPSRGSSHLFLVGQSYATMVKVRLQSKSRTDRKLYKQAHSNYLNEIGAFEAKLAALNFGPNQLKLATLQYHCRPIATVSVDKNLQIPGLTRYMRSQTCGFVKIMNEQTREEPRSQLLYTKSINCTSDKNQSHEPWPDAF